MKHPSIPYIIYALLTNGETVAIITSDYPCKKKIYNSYEEFEKRMEKKRIKKEVEKSYMDRKEVIGGLYKESNKKIKKYLRIKKLEKIKKQDNNNKNINNNIKKEKNINCYEIIITKTKNIQKNNFTIVLENKFEILSQLIESNNAKIEENIINEFFSKKVSKKTKKIKKTKICSVIKLKRNKKNKKINEKKEKKEKNYPIFNFLVKEKIEENNQLSNTRIIEINNTDVSYMKNIKEIEEQKKLIKQKYMKLVLENIVVDEELGVFDVLTKQNIYENILNTDKDILNKIKDYFIKKNKENIEFSYIMEFFYNSYIEEKINFKITMKEKKKNRNNV